MEETSLLDPRIKTSYLTEEEGFKVITRVTSEAANAPVVIKKEPGVKIVSEYDQEIPQSQTADNPVAQRGRAAQPSRDTRKIN